MTFLSFCFLVKYVLVDSTLKRKCLHFAFSVVVRHFTWTLITHTRVTSTDGVASLLGFDQLIFLISLTLPSRSSALYAIFCICNFSLDFFFGNHNCNYNSINQLHSLPTQLHNLVLPTRKKHPYLITEKMVGTNKTVSITY